MSNSLLDDVMKRLSGMSPAEIAELEKSIEKEAQEIWIPSHGPQYTAYFHPADELLYGGSGGSGKALDVATDIPTPAGFKPMGLLSAGDEVLDERGQICRVTACSPIMVDRPCYQLTFYDGSQIVADADHRWPVWNLRTESVRTTEEIAASVDPLGVIRPGRDFRYITAVERVDTRPVKCISVDSESRLFLCGRGMIPTHNSDLALGLAFTAHWNSLILRRQYVDLGGMIERAIEINGTRDGFSGAVPPRLYTKNGRRIVFGAHKEAGDEQSFQGAPYSLKVFDEAVQHLLSQIKFHLGWLRSTRIDEKGNPERCRAVLATNPPIDSSGDWIIGRYRPWLDLTHHNPAKHGEMRWFITNPDGEDQEVDGPEPIEFTVNGVTRTYKPLSRTFIPGKLSDNPYLVNTNYQSQLDALPEPIRSAVRDGNFMLSRADAMNQLIPTDWVLAAQARWNKDNRRGKKMSVMGYDPAGGGRDSAELAMRYGFHYSEIATVKGDDTRDGSMTVALLFRYRRDNAVIVIDHGGGYAGQTVLRLRDNEIDFVAFNGNHAGVGRDASGKLRFHNHRAEAWWKFREALDPDQPGGSQIELPPNAELRADLTAPIYKVERDGIWIEPKESVKKKLGRSPGKADAVVIAWHDGNAAIRRRDSAESTSRRVLPTHSQTTRDKSPLARRRGR